MVIICYPPECVLYGAVSSFGKGTDYLIVSGAEILLMRPRNWFIAMLAPELAQK